MGRAFKIRQLARAKTIAAIAVVNVLVFAGVVIIIRGTTEEPQSESSTQIELAQFSDEKQNVSLSYPNEANKLALTPKDIADNFLLRVGVEDEMPYLITLRYEDGLRTGAQLARVDTIDLLLTTLNKSFPNIYKDFMKISESKFDREGKEAAFVEFQYTGPSGEIANQRVNIFLRDDDTAYYLAMQSKKKDVESLTPTFYAVSNSFRFESKE